VVRTVCKAILCILLAVMQSGCTVAGLTIGAIDDVSSRKPGRHRIGEIKVGEQVEITQMNGEVFAGTFAGTSAMDEQDYAQLLQQSRDRLPEDIKYLGGNQQVEVIRNNVKKYKGTIVGYAPDSVYIKLPVNPMPVPVGLYAKLRFNCDDSRTANVRMIGNLLEEHALPIRTIVHLKTGGGIKPIPAQNIFNVRLTESRHKGKLIGGGVGLLIDGLLVLWAASSWTASMAP
jgi:hypothetical protein